MGKTQFIALFCFPKPGLPIPAGGLTFLSLNKKVSKEVSLGEGLSCLLPQTKPPPLRTPPGPHFRFIQQGFGAVNPKSETFCNLT